MIVRWEGETALVDAQALAQLYGVSVRTVRRHCTPARHIPTRGRGTGQALYDAFAAGEQLAAVVPRPARTAAATRLRRAG